MLSSMNLCVCSCCVVCRSFLVFMVVVGCRFFLVFKLSLVSSGVMLWFLVRWWVEWVVVFLRLVFGRLVFGVVIVVFGFRCLLLVVVVWVDWRFCCVFFFGVVLWCRLVFWGGVGSWVWKCLLVLCCLCFVLWCSCWICCLSLCMCLCWWFIWGWVFGCIFGVWLGLFFCLGVWW